MASCDYNAFGETIVADGAAVGAFPFEFSTKYAEAESQILYYGLRYYSPTSGRWLSGDPLGEMGGENVYRSALNNPVNYFDPLGREPQSPTPTVDAQGNWHDSVTGRFVTAPQLPAPPGSLINMPSSRDAGNSVGGLGKAVIELAKRIPQVILEGMLKHGQSECQRQQPYAGCGCACCVVRIYKITSISATVGNQDTYVYGFARVVKDGCDKVKKAWENGPEIVLLYAPHDTEMEVF